ncbi:hypothetical protein R6Q59_003131 [Mikania micrantha]
MKSMLMRMEGSQIKVFKPHLLSIKKESLVCELKDVLAGADWMSKIIPGDEAVVECQVVEEVELCGTLKDVAIAAENALYYLHNIGIVHRDVKPVSVPHTCFMPPGHIGYTLDHTYKFVYREKVEDDTEVDDQKEQEFTSIQ